MKPIRIFRHQDWIQPGRLTDFLDERAIAWELVAVDRGETVPQRLDDVAGLVFLGGTMSVNDPHGWLADEVRLIRSAAAVDLPMLGHCLGSQLIAKALGANVGPMAAKEIGWHRVTRLDAGNAPKWLDRLPGQADVLIWHHEAFTLPQGAVPLYSSAHCPVQVFAIGNTVATVSHAEVTAPMLEQWLHIYGYDIEPVSPSVQPADRIREQLAQRCAQMHGAFTDLLYEAWIDRLHERAASASA
jgi:GMP synthase-like glutamine amidotransferase